MLDSHLDIIFEDFMVKSDGSSFTQIVLDFDLKVVRQCLVFHLIG